MSEELTPMDRMELWMSALNEAITNGAENSFMPYNRYELWMKKLCEAILAKDPADPAVVQEFVEEWLDDHPEATTTVEDGAVTSAKLADSAYHNTAATFDTTKAYSAGDYCIYSGALYRFTADKTAGAWDSTKAVTVALADDLNQYKKASELTQLVKNGNFADNSNWIAQFSTLSVSSNEATVTVNNANNSQFYQSNITYTTGHVYLIKFTAKGSKNGKIAFNGIASSGEKIPFDLTTSYQTFVLMWAARGTTSSVFHFWLARDGWQIQDFGVGDSVTFKNIMLFDLTAMYGKNNEPAQNEFLSVYSKDYYDFNKPEAYPIRDFNNTSLNVINSRFSVANRFDKSSAVRNLYVVGGVIAPVNGYSISQMIYIGDLESFSYSYTFRISLYTENFAWVSDPATQATVGTMVTIPVPSTVKYCLISYLTANENLVQVGSGISVDDYVPYGTFTMPSLVIPASGNKAKVTVSKSNRGDYSSILEALVSTDGDVEVVDGAYDIVAEYKAKYGNDFFDDNKDRSGAGNFKLGLYITNRTLKFDANTSVSFDLTSNPASNENDDDRRFSLFNLGVNAVLDGAIGTTAYNWYAIHDDGAGGDYAANYHNTIKNCVIISSNMVNVNSIGGGFGRYSETDIDNCYFDNGGANDSYTIRYHNTWNGQAQPICHVQNTYCNAKMGFWKYGSSTKIGTVTVNNCSLLGDVELLAIGEAADNLRILQFANVDRT